MVLMCLLLDQELQAGEVVRLEVDHVDLAQSTLRVASRYQNRWHAHRLTADVQRLLQTWMTSSDCPASGLLLRASRMGGTLVGAGLTERAIAKRVAVLGRRVGLPNLCPNDCRGFWAAQAVVTGYVILTCYVQGASNSGGGISHSEC
jgi:integrase